MLPFCCFVELHKMHMPAQQLQQLQQSVCLALPVLQLSLPDVFAANSSTWHGFQPAFQLLLAVVRVSAALLSSLASQPAITEVKLHGIDVQMQSKADAHVSSRFCC